MAMPKARASHGASKTSSPFLRGGSIEPSGSEPVRAISLISRCLSSESGDRGRRLDPGHAHQGVARDECYQLLLGHPFGASRTLGEDHIAALRGAVPDANLDRFVDFGAELAQDTAGIDHDARAIRRALVPTGRQTNHPPRVTGAECAADDVVHLGCAL